MSPATAFLGDVGFVVAAFNEERVLGGVVAELIKLSVGRVIVVDDGSADDTARVASLAGALVVRHPLNLGQGAALQTGFVVARRLGLRFVVTFDADGQHRFEDAALMVQRARESGIDVILGSRFLGAQSNIPRARRWLLRWATLFTRVTTGLRLSDAHNGLRVLSGRALESIHLRQNRMAHASEILEQIGSMGLSYEEMPVTIRYTDYSMAKGQRTTGALAILYDLFAARFTK